MPQQPADVAQQRQINAGIVTLAAAQTAALWPQVDWGSPAAAKAVRTLYGALWPGSGRLRRRWQPSFTTSSVQQL
jgi:hypothetical protein